MNRCTRTHILSHRECEDVPHCNGKREDCQLQSGSHPVLMKRERVRLPCSNLKVLYVQRYVQNMCASQHK